MPLKLLFLIEATTHLVSKQPLDSRKKRVPLSGDLMF